VSELTRLVELHYENQSTGRFERDAEVFTDDVVTVIPGSSELHGLAAFEQVGRMFHEAFPDATMSMRSAVESGDTIMVEGTYAGTHTGPLRGPAGDIPATGRSVRVDFADVFVRRGDRFAEHRVYFDMLTMMGQLGVLAAPEAPAVA
jgi:predicted ester cyclase